MATSWTSLNNQALAILGADQISNIDTDTTDNAVKCRAVYESVRDELLRSHEWNFAIAWASMAALAADPDNPDFEYNYTLPTAPYCLRVLKIEGNYPFRVEGRKLLTDQSSPVNIKYISRVSNAATLDVSFVSAYVLLLAIRLCVSITASRTLKEDLKKDFAFAILEAQGNNAIESKWENDVQSETDRWEDAGR
ncbi:hypothetical protein K9N50_10750 [bacterium]|nr:hypothetical protein [bacterium]